MPFLKESHYTTPKDVSDMLLITPLSSASTHSTRRWTKHVVRWAIGLVIAVSLVYVGFYIGSHTNSFALPLTDTVTNPPILQTIQINKRFSFPVLDSQGKRVADISYIITSVDKQGEIIIKGERAQAVEGRTFFIINLSLVNSSDQTIQLNTRDYVRLTVGNSKDFLASDIHNDPVIVQPISTVYTRLGFPIPSSAKQLTIHVGQLTGPKTDIPITFTR